MSSTSKPARPRFNRALLIVVIVVTVGGVLGFVVLSFGRVQGTEFAPDHFSRREFVFYQIPLIQLQITPVVRWGVTNDLEDHLTRKKIVPRLSNRGRWDSVEVRIGSAQAKGEALILCNYLDAKDRDGDLRWLNWTKSNDNAKKAKPFWKAIRQAALLEAYFCIPELFQLADDPSDADAFAKKLDELTLRKFTEAAEDYYAVGEFELADRFYTAALRISPDDAQLKKMQSKTRLQLGKPVESSPADSA